MTQAAQLAQMGSPGVSLGFKNRIINGDMRIDQRNAGASVTFGNGTTAGSYTGFGVDRFFTQSYSTIAGNGAAFTAQQNAGSVTPPPGFNNYVGATVTSAQATLQNNSVYRFVQRIEGYNLADLGWGTANASPVTLSFWVRSSYTGTFGVALTNASGGSAWRSYTSTYTINSANTWEYKTITIPGDTSGAWNKINGNGIELSFAFGVSAGFSTAPGSWLGTESYGAVGVTNMMATVGATFYITGIQLEKGSTATSFDYRDYTRELQMCQRYYWMIDGGVSNYSSFNVGWYNSLMRTALQCPVQMRASPSITFTGTAGGAFFSTNNDSSYTNFTYTGSGSGQQRSTTAVNIQGNADTASGSGILYIQSNRKLEISAEL